MTTALEIAIQDPEGYRIAAQTGANRVELCTALAATGGMTPSTGLLTTVLGLRSGERVVGWHAPQVHVLIRPRPGDFHYGSDDIDVMVHDIQHAREAGADGVVIGALTPEGTVDTDTLHRLIDAAGNCEITFHRAVDTVADPLAALDTLIESGVTRVLTSGGAPRSIDGTARLAAMVRHAGGRVQVMAGGGVRVADIPVLLGTGVDAVHLSASRPVIASGGPGGGGDAGYTVTDPEVAAAAASAVRGQTDAVRPTRGERRGASNAR